MTDRPETPSPATHYGPTMRFSTSMPGLTRYPPIEFDWSRQMSSSDFQQVAQVADTLGYDAINVPEHIVLPVSLSEAMGSFWPHALTAMAFIAGATTRILVNSSVIILPYHNPLNLAKAIATLDVMCGGRLIVSLGVGHAEGEFEALGIPFSERGRIANEYLDAMHVLWTADAPTFQGHYVSFRDVLFEPRPFQKPHPPLWFGGNSRAALRRAARYGQGWFPWLISADELSGYIAELETFPEFAAKREGFDITLSISPLRVRQHDHRPSGESDGSAVRFSSTQEVVDAIRRLEDMGVTWTSVQYPGRRPRSLNEHLEQLAWAAEEIFPLFRLTPNAK
jgi:probable F420-dependent oxidoreductase